MKYLLITTSLILAGLTGACSTTASVDHAVAPVANNAFQLQRVVATKETLLLVSLEDGSVIMQSINSDADVCFKKISDSATICLYQGEAIVDPETQSVIGYETTESRIDLVASARL